MEKIGQGTVWQVLLELDLFCAGSSSKDPDQRFLRRAFTAFYSSTITLYPITMFLYHALPFYLKARLRRSSGPECVRDFFCGPPEDLAVFFQLFQVEQNLMFSRWVQAHGIGLINHRNNVHGCLWPRGRN